MRIPGERSTPIPNGPNSGSTNAGNSIRHARPEALTSSSSTAPLANLSPSPSRAGFLATPSSADAMTPAEIQLGSPPPEGESSAADHKWQTANNDRRRRSPSPAPGGAPGPSPGIEIDMSYYSGGESALGSASTVDPERPPSRSRTQNRSNTPEPPIGLGVGLVNGLGNLSTSRADKRGSINPEMVISYQQQQNLEEPLSGPSSALNYNKDFYSGRSSPSPVMDNFSAGRHSPLPNSPLRASFTDAEARENEKAAARGASHLPSPTSKNWPSANSRLAPAGQSQSQNTSKGRMPISRTHSDTTSTADTPPRSSSLTESMDTMVNKDSSSAANDRDDETIKEKTVYKRMQSSDATNPPKPLQSQPNAIDAPRIDAPAWSSLGFSLSDPDFAKLLAENKASPEKAKQGLAAREASPARSRLQTTAGERLQPLQQPLRTPSSSSLPASPVLTHSPPLQTIMATYAADTGKPADRPKRSDSLRSLKGREAEPQLQAGERRPRPALVKTKTSSEDLAAGMSELKIPVHETALPVLEALLASATDTPDAGDQVTMKKELLERVINEIQTLSDQVTVLKDKYTGARVCSAMISR